MLSVVIPTFNESKNIRNLVAQVDVALKGVDYEIVFVDDSKDNTPDVIMEVAKEYSMTAYNTAINSYDSYKIAIDKIKNIIRLYFC